MNVNLETNEIEYDPGDMIQFRGNVVPLLPENNGKHVSAAAFPPVTVVVSLVDNEGIVLTAEAVQVNQRGYYHGYLIAPPETRGEIFLIAEAAVDDPKLVLRSNSWYGRAERVLVFPLNLAPQVSLDTTTISTKQEKPVVQVNAHVTDSDSQNDIELITVTVNDGNGHLLKSWQANDFRSRNNTWALSKRNPLSGVSPWRVTLTAEDSVGNVATTSQLIF